MVEHSSQILASEEKATTTTATTTSGVRTVPFASNTPTRPGESALAAVATIVICLGIRVAFESHQSSHCCFVPEF